MPAVENGRTLAGVIAELKSEIKEFAQTRLEMLRTELRDKVRSWKLALPFLAVALLLLATTWLLLTGALVAIIAFAFHPSPLAVFYGLLIVGLAYGLGGGICALVAVRELKEKGIMPKRTLRTLKDDAVWLQTEAKGQI